MTVIAPPLKRRLAGMLYEALLLFGVVFFAGWIFSTLLQQKHALFLRHAMQLWLFLILGLYFVWFWTHGGQTLPMKTWRIRLVQSNGDAVGVGRAIWRYCLAWFWLLPGLMLASAFNTKDWLMILLPTANMALWALAVYLDPQRQFLHDRIAGTRLIASVALPATSPAPQVIE